MRYIITLASVAVVSNFPANAHDLNKALAKPPAATYVSNKKLFDIERCLIMLDTPEPPVAYRTPDRPDYSLIYWRTMVVELIREVDSTRIVVRNPAARGFEKRFKICA